jgi:hypothetical protein
MNDIIAENKILRKMAKVPLDFGFDLEKIKKIENSENRDLKF